MTCKLNDYLPPIGENLTSLLVADSVGRWNKLTPDAILSSGSAHVTERRSTDGWGDDGVTSNDACLN